MTTSILLAGEQGGLKPGPRQAAATAFLNAYIGLIHTLSRLPVLEIARYQVHRLQAVEPLGTLLRKAERTTPLHSLDQLTVPGKKSRVFHSHPPLLRPLEGKERTAVIGSLKGYRKSLAPERQHFFSQFRVLDAAFKVVGVGSVGMRSYCVYLEGNGPDDPLFLQIKEETASAYARYLPKNSGGEGGNGRRVVNGQRAMQLQTDPLLGWTRIGDHDFLVRQLNDHKATLDATTLDETGLTAYATVCGEMLAHGHARSGNASLLSGYLGNGRQFPEAMLRFAHAYAEQTAHDWKALKQQLKQE